MMSSQADIKLALQALVECVGSQSAAARVLQISRSHVNHLLAGRKEFGDVLARRLGFRRVVVYEKRVR